MPEWEALAEPLEDTEGLSKGDHDAEPEPLGDQESEGDAEDPNDPVKLGAADTDTERSGVLELEAHAVLLLEVVLRADCEGDAVTEREMVGDGELDRVRVVQAVAEGLAVTEREMVGEGVADAERLTDTEGEMEPVGRAVAVFVADTVDVGVCRCVGEVVEFEDLEGSGEAVSLEDALEELVSEGECVLLTEADVELLPQPERVSLGEPEPEAVWDGEPVEEMDPEEERDSTWVAKLDKEMLGLPDSEAEPVAHPETDTEAVEEGEELAVEVGDAVEVVEAEEVEDMEAEEDFVEEEEPDAVDVGLAEPVVEAVDVAEVEAVALVEGVEVVLEETLGEEVVVSDPSGVLVDVVVMVGDSVPSGELDTVADSVQFAVASAEGVSKIEGEPEGEPLSLGDME